MFQVKCRKSGEVYTVYAVIGTLFLVWDDEDECWAWRDMSGFVPLHGEVRA